MGFLAKFYSKKAKVLIFGTGAGGKSAYEANRSEINIIGFLDNNPNKYGRHYMGAIIYAPAELQKLEYDYILVASDYADEITSQLINDLDVPKYKIIFNTFDHAISKDIFALVFEKMKTSIFEKISYKLYSLIHSKLSFILKHLKEHQVYELSWLDCESETLLSQIRPELRSVTIGPKFLDKKQRIKNITIPAVNAYLFHNATTTTTSRSWILCGTKVIVERIPEVRTEICDYAHGQITKQNSKFALIRDYKALPIPEGILITGASDTNYYHWLIEIIPQLQYLNELPNSFINYPILISEQMTKIGPIAELFSCFPVTREVLYLKSNTPYNVQNMVVISSPNLMLTNLKSTTYSPVESSYFRAESINYIRNLALAYSNGAKSAFNSRIFLARKGKNRQYNQGDVVKLLLTYDFSIVYFEDLSFVQQVACIQQAKIIIGPSGAALANLIFANKNTKALYWAAASNGDASCFSNIASIMEFTLDCIGYELQSSNTRETYHLPYLINIKLIKLWLDNNANY